MATVAENVIKRFGGIWPLSRKLGHENASTVQGWKERGRIPDAHWPVIERAAAAEGFDDLTVEQLALDHAQQARAAAVSP